MRASRSAGRRELALWLQREGAAGWHVPSALGGSGRGQLGLWRPGHGPDPQEFMTAPADSPFLEKGRV